MRDVSAIANVSLATIYRYFSSKDHLLAAAMTEWTDEAAGPGGPVAAAGRHRRPTRSSTCSSRACRAMARQPKLSAALVRALASSDPGVQQSAERGPAPDRAMAGHARPTSTPGSGPTSSPCSATSGTRRWCRGPTAASTSTRSMAELERAVRVLVEPYERPPDPVTARGSRRPVRSDHGGCGTCGAARQTATVTSDGGRHRHRARHVAEQARLAEQRVQRRSGPRRCRGCATPPPAPPGRARRAPPPAELGERVHGDRDGEPRHDEVDIARVAGGNEPVGHERQRGDHGHPGGRRHRAPAGRATRTAPPPRPPARTRGR